MLKSTLIAKCLYQCSMIPDISTGEAAVESIFSEYFPKHNYKNWNTHISDETVKFFLRHQVTPARYVLICLLKTFGIFNW